MRVMTEKPAFEAAYARHLPAVRARCRRILGRSAAADEVVQETFLRLWHVGPWTESPSTVGGWLRQTSTRLAIDELRASSRAPAVDPSALDVAVAPSGARACKTLVARSDLRALAAAVPSDELEAAVLARAHELTRPEVARELGVSERTVGRLLARFDARRTRLHTIACGILLAALVVLSSRSCAATERAGRAGVENVSVGR
jgi:RNA polymerase sigma-70 factor (ECF subfamily)